LRADAGVLAHAGSGVGDDTLVTETKRREYSLRTIGEGNSQGVQGPRRRQIAVGFLIGYFHDFFRFLLELFSARDYMANRAKVTVSRAEKLVPSNFQSSYIEIKLLCQGYVEFKDHTGYRRLSADHLRPGRGGATGYRRQSGRGSRGHPLRRKASRWRSESCGVIF